MLPKSGDNRGASEELEIFLSCRVVQEYKCCRMKNVGPTQHSTRQSQVSPRVLGYQGCHKAFCVCTSVSPAQDFQADPPNQAACTKSHLVERGSQTPHFGLWPILLHSRELWTHISLRSGALSCFPSPLLRLPFKHIKALPLGSPSLCLRTNNCLAEAGC